MSKNNIYPEEENSENAKNILCSILEDEAAAHRIDEQDVQILLLRLGLKSKKCYTLVETGYALHMSAERVRQRQYFLLRRKIKNPLFFEQLKIYARSRKLPKGLEHFRDIFT